MYPFGYGLSYGDVRVKEAKVAGRVTAESDIRVSVALTNQGQADTDEVVQVYIKDLESDLAVPNYSLCGFQRVSLKAGEEKDVELTIPNRAMCVVDEEGERHVDSKKFKLFVGTSQPDARSLRLTGKEPAEILVTLD